MVDMMIMTHMRKTKNIYSSRLMVRCYFGRRVSNRLDKICGFLAIFYGVSPLL